MQFYFKFLLLSNNSFKAKTNPLYLAHYSISNFQEDMFNESADYKQKSKLYYKNMQYNISQINTHELPFISPRTHVQTFGLEPSDQTDPRDAKNKNKGKIYQNKFCFHQMDSIFQMIILIHASFGMCLMSISRIYIGKLIFFPSLADCIFYFYIWGWTHSEGVW